jgi:hypothetical protein
VVNFSLVSNSANATPTSGSCTINSGNSCPFTVNTAQAGVVVVEATTTVTVSGQTITRATNTAANTNAGGSGNATKTYVNLRISLSPLTDTNAVNDPHTFTVTVEQNNGSSWSFVNGASVSFLFATNTANAFFTGLSTCTTGVNGTCTVTINAPNAGTVVLQASTTVSVSGESITRQTGTAVNSAAGGSGNATKLYVAGSIGDFVWWDINKNGIQDAGEPGIQGVTVNLYNNGTCTGSPVATTTTNANGGYTFSNLGTGTYCIEIPASQFTGSGVLTNWQISPANVGSDDTIDSDGIQVGSAVQIQNRSIDPVNSPQNDPTNDFGFYKNSNYTITKVRVTDPSGEGVAVNSLIDFDITVTNTGATWLSVVPLEDDYDPQYLNFISATPLAPNSVDATNGILRWNDITGAGQLAPGNAITIRVTFQGVGDTTQLLAQSPCTESGNTCNVARTRDGNNDGPTADPDGPGPLQPLEELDPKEDSDPAKIINPTSVNLVGQAMELQANQITLRWATVIESEIAGFNIYRVANGAKIKLNAKMIEAEKSGMSEGYNYSISDTQLGIGVNVSYQLEMVMLNGRTETYELASLRWIFMPGILRR